MAPTKYLARRLLSQESLRTPAMAFSVRRSLQAVSPWSSSSCRHTQALRQTRCFGTSVYRPSDSSTSAPLAMDPESPHVKSLIASGWQLDDSKMGISKTFYFKTFTKCQVGITEITRDNYVRSILIIAFVSRTSSI